MVTLHPMQRTTFALLLAAMLTGCSRESADPAPYLAAFDAMQAEGGNALIVESGSTRVLLDCGFGIRETERRLERLALVIPARQRAEGGAVRRRAAPSSFAPSSFPN